MVKINFTSGLADFHQKQYVTASLGTLRTLVASLLKIGGGLISVVRSTRFV